MALFLFLRKNPRVVILVAVLLLCIYTTFLYLTVGQRGHDTILTNLSTRFTEGKVSMSIYRIPERDISNYYGNYYVYFGPLSSLMLMPFVYLFGEKTPQVLIGVFSMLVSFPAVYFLARNFKFSKTDSLWLSTFFVFSTVMFSSSVINVTAYQVEALGVPFVLLALCMYFYKRNAFFIGLFIACALMTRITLVGVVAFFFFEIFYKRFTIKQFIVLLIPVVLALGVVGAYNERRFHSFLETGYKYNITKATDNLKLNYEYGEISPIHIPANLYSFLIMSPEPVLKEHSQELTLRFPYLRANAWGMAIWFTSPLFLYLVLHFKKGKYTVSSAATAFILSIPVFLWYSVGYAQFGYRYALDFLPFLLLILIPSLGSKLSKTALVLIILGVLFNLIYSVSMWGMYPLFNIYP